MTEEARRMPLSKKEGAVSFSGLRAFVAIAEAQSFSGAAQALGMAQPTLSVQLAALEQACGVLLFHRKPQLALTEAGRDLFVRARLILSRITEFESSVRALRDVSRGSLAIGLSAPYEAMPLIAAFSTRHPAVQLRTVIGNTSTLLDDIQKCRIDLGIMSLMEPSPPFSCTLIATPRLSICVHKDDPLAGRPSVRPAELAGRDFILREEGSMTRRSLEAAFAAEGIPLRAKFVLASREAIKEAVVAGLGLGAVFEEGSHDVRLTTVPFVGLPSANGVYAVALRESLDIPTVRTFVDLVPTLAAKP